ncbi:hypothetical protein ABT354_06545 [Streptomyces sp. NPDC000594]|uniref:hypothetical protein n=1 Tax=Streptomyces sp. NPDC000594 TaxID=3154261 RepID=UPI003319BB2C
MTVSPLRDLPPHLRLLAWPTLNGRVPLPGVRVHAAGAPVGGPVSMACYSRGTTVEFAAGTDPEALLKHPAAALSLTVPLRLVGTLVLWDEAIREAGVYSGSICLASEESVARLMRTAHTTADGDGDDPAPLPGGLPELLEQLQALDLLYRFPVAYRFRGSPGPERQCRVNGWGRLAVRLLWQTAGDPHGLEPARQRLARHLAEHRSTYLRGVRAATAAEDRPGTTRIWDHIHAEQPIPVLI